jgi:putative Holliday junction resolvase
VRLMALDLGERRIGVALSDPGQSFARALQVIRRRARHQDMARISALVEEHSVERIVVGHPLNLDGSAGEQALRIEAYAAELQEAVNVPVVLCDESYSTERARQVMIEAGRRRKERRERLDAVAAAVILQDYMDSQRHRTAD